MRKSVVSAVVGVAVGLASSAFAVQEKWVEVANGPGKGGFVRHVLQDSASPSTLYAAVFGAGVYVTSNGGTSWSKTAGMLPNTRINVMRGNAANVTLAGLLVLGTDGSGVLVSTNGGASWTQQNNGLGCHYVRQLRVQGSTPYRVYAATYCDQNSGVYTGTMDASGNIAWSLITAPLGNLKVSDVRGSNDGVNVSALGEFGLRTTPNGGASWLDRTGSGATNIWQGSAVQYTPNILFINGPGGFDYVGVPGLGILRSVAGGSSWSPVNGGLPGAAPNIQVEVFAPDGSNFMAFVDGDGIYTTPMAANPLAWTKLTGDVRFGRYMMSDATNAAIKYAVTFNGVWKSTNSGVNFSPVNTGLPEGAIGNIVSDPANANILYATAETVYKSTDGGGTWAKADTGINSTTVGNGRVRIDGSGNLYVSTRTAGVFKSTNAGASWSKLTGLQTAINTFKGTTAPIVSQAPHVRTDPSGLYVFFDGNEYGIYRSTDGGSTWSALNTGLAGGALNIRDLAISVGGVAMLATRAGLYRSIGGAPWENASPFGLATHFNTVRFDSSATPALMAGSAAEDNFGLPTPNSGVYVSQNGGQASVPSSFVTWSQVAAGVKNVNIQTVQRAGKTDFWFAIWGEFSDLETGDEFRPGMARLTSVALDNSTIFKDRWQGLDMHLPRNLLFDASGNVRFLATYSGLMRNVRSHPAPDFNDDGMADVLWRNIPAGGQNAIWLTTESNHNNIWVDSGFGLPSAAAPWVLTGTGDFDGDGKSDFLWRNTTTGDNAIWLLDGMSLKDANVLANVSLASGWSIAGTGDFDGDGKTDIMWTRNNGENALWLMNGFTFTGALLPTLTDTNWKVAVIADTDGNGKSDIVWRHSVTGENAVWVMNGATLTGGALLPQVADLNFKIVGAGDYNGDGKQDLVWRHSTSGQNAIWFMNGLSFADGVNINVVPSAAWTIVGTGDNDGDGNDDLLWRNTSTGEMFFWKMFGATPNVGNALSGNCGIGGCTPGQLPTVTGSWGVIPR